MVGGDYLPRNLACLSEEGRHVSIAFQRGAKGELLIPDIMDAVDKIAPGEPPEQPTKIVRASLGG